MVRPVRVLGPGGRGHTLLRASSCSVVTPRAATQWISSPSKRNTPTYAQSQSRLALSAIAWATGCKSVGDSRITRRISLVAVCCSRPSASRLSVCAVSLRAAARRFSTSPSPEPSSLGDLRPTRGLASLDLVGFRPRRIGLPLPPINGPGTGYGQPVCRGKGPANLCWVSPRLTPDLSSVAVTWDTGVTPEAPRRYIDSMGDWRPARTVRVQTDERPAEIYHWIMPPRS